MWEGFYSHTRTDQQIAAAASSAGVATGALGPVPPGFCWYVERLSCWSNTGATSGITLEVYVGATSSPPSSPDKTGRVDLSTSPANDQSDENSPIYLGPGQYLLASWAGFTSGDLLRMNCQIRVHELVIARQPHRHQPALAPAEPDPQEG